MRRMCKLLACCAALAGLTLAGAAWAKELRIGIRACPESMDPHYMATGPQIAAMKNVYEAMVFFDDKLQVKPGLAEKWENVDDNTWRFHLRPGVKFHNGDPLTAEDVKFTFARIPKAAGPDGGIVINARNIESVTAVDPLTVLIKTSIPNPYLPQDLARIFITPKSIGDAKVEDFNNAKAAFGTGPFRLISYKARTGYELAANEGYWGGKPEWDKVTFTEISSDSARVAALKSRRVDLINYVPFADVQGLERDSGIEVIQGESIYIFLLYPDMRPQSDLITDKSGKPLAVNPLTDVRVREALSLAIDRKALADVALEGFGQPARQIIDDNFFGAIPNPPELEYNPDKGRQMLADAGYPDGFTISLYCTNDRLPGDSATCTALGQMFSRIGIDTKVNAVSRTVYLPARTRGEYMLTMSGWGSVTGEAGYTLAAMCHTNDPAKGLGAFNVWHLSDPALDELVVKSIGAMNDDNRRELFAQANQLLLDKFYAIPVTQISSVWAARSRTLSFAPRVDEETLPQYISGVK